MGFKCCFGKAFKAVLNKGHDLQYKIIFDFSDSIIPYTHWSASDSNFLPPSLSKKKKKNKKEKEEKENTGCPLYSFVYLHTVEALCSQGRSGSQTDISHEHLDYTD